MCCDDDYLWDDGQPSDLQEHADFAQDDIPDAEVYYGLPTWDAVLDDYSEEERHEFWNAVIRDYHERGSDHGE